MKIVKVIKLEDEDVIDVRIIRETRGLATNRMLGLANSVSTITSPGQLISRDTLCNALREFTGARKDFRTLAEADRPDPITVASKDEASAIADACEEVIDILIGWFETLEGRKPTDLEIGQARGQ